MISVLWALCIRFKWVSFLCLAHFCLNFVDDAERVFLGSLRLITVQFSMWFSSENSIRSTMIMITSASHMHIMCFQIDFIERKNEKCIPSSDKWIGDVEQRMTKKSSQLSRWVCVFLSLYSVQVKSERRNHKRWRKEYEHRTESQWGALSTRSFLTIWNSVEWTQEIKNAHIKHETSSSFRKKKKSFKRKKILSF